AALIDHVGLEDEAVGVACAGQRHSHVDACDRIAGTAANALLRSIVERNRAAASPVAGHARKGSTLGVSIGSRKTSNKQKSGCHKQPPNIGKIVEGLVGVTGALLASVRCKVCLLMPHSTFPIRHCR